MESSFRFGVVQLALLLSCVTGARAIVCYSCQYSDNPQLLGYECVTSPADYTLGPSTTVCDTACMSEVQQLAGTNTIYFMYRGCKTKEDGCTSGSIDICVETCSDADLCNSKSYAPETLPPTTPPLSTVAPTTTTEVPGTISCYSCVYSYNPGYTDACVTDPANAPPPNEVRCPPPRVCYIYRQWDKGMQVVRSFARGCEDPQGHVNQCIDDIYFTTCYTFCNYDYCNSGDGTLPAKIVRFPKAQSASAADGKAAIAV